jgi:GT2 family glycosyltransferase
MLTISILNYNSYSETEQCIRDLVSVCNDLVYRILVRDNSEASQIQLLQKSLRDISETITYFSSPENPGFGAGHNRNFLAVEHAPDDPFLILNDDVRLSNAQVIHAMLAALTQHRIVSPVIRTGSGGIWYAGGSVRPLTGDVIVDRTAVQGEHRNTSFISGCCMLVSAELFEKLGGFDELFFMYSEDLDLCLRARALGAELTVISAEIVHKPGSGEKGTYSDLYLYEGTKNRLLCLRRHKLGILPVSIAYAFLKYGVLRTVQLALHSQNPARQTRAAWRGLLHGLLLRAEKLHQ